MAGKGTQNCYSNCEKGGWQIMLQESIGNAYFTVFGHKFLCMAVKKSSSGVKTELETLSWPVPVQSKQGN